VGRIALIITDTGFWVATFDRNDRYHSLAVEKLRVLPALVTTLPVVTETSHLLLRRVGISYVLALLRSHQRGAFSLFTLEDAHIPRVNELMTAYADLPMDFADASLVVLAESLGHGRILTTDQRDFQIYRWQNNRPFQNLLLVQP
jgi:predicted nucleic acid-binding protein